MGKLFIALSSFVLAVSAFAAAPKAQAPEAGTTHNDLATMMEGFINADKQYTKKSRIYFNSDALEVAKNYLHASNVAVDRTTYYDEDYNDGGALLMGDYNGGFTINSGYATNSSGKLDHYRGTSVGDPDGKLFSERNVDYTVNSTCNEYFDVLGGLIAQIRDGSASDWTYADGVYTHKTPATITLDAHGNYNDILLKKFQYFGAPMLLQSAGASASNFLTFSSIKVENKTDYLSIKLMLSSGNQGLTTTPVEGDEVMLSEARVYKGLSFFAPYHATINGKFVEVKDEKSTLKPEGSDKAVFQLELNKDDKVVFYHGTDAVDYGTYVVDHDESAGYNEYTAKSNQHCIFYYNAAGFLYKEVDLVHINFVINSYDTHGGKMFVCGNFVDNWATKFEGSWSTGNKWTIRMSLAPNGTTYLYKFVAWNNDMDNWHWESDPNRSITVTEESGDEIHNWNDHTGS